MILVVDDDAMLREVLEAFLLLEDFEVQLAHNGQMALDWLEQNLPHLIVLDVRLPDMDGLEICQQLKARSRTADIPIMMMSGLTEKEDIQRGLDAGADDYLTLPLDSVDLIARVRRLLNG